VSQNLLAVVLALIILAVVIGGWIVQLGGGYRAGSSGAASYGRSAPAPSQSLQGTT
jgi:hypothetical protein